MKKRVLSVLLTLVMALGLLPGGVLAAEEAVHDHTGWTAWSDAASLPTDAGSYYLSGAETSMILNGGWNLAKDGETKLCLNGKALEAGNYLRVEGGAKLTLSDCGNGAGIQRKGATIWVGYYQGLGELVLEGGKLVNTQTEDTLDEYERLTGAIDNGGYVTLKGGEVSGPYGVNFSYVDRSYTKSPITLAGTPTLNGSLADIHIVHDDASISHLPLIDATSYTGSETVSIAVDVNDGNLEGKLGAPIVKLGDTTDADKFTLVGADGYCLAADETDPAVLVLAVQPHSHAMSADCSTTEGDQVEFTAWSDATTLPGTAGNYYLTTDVTLPNTSWNAPTGTVNLCLNGHTVMRNGGNYGAIAVPSGATLNLCDCGDGGVLAHSTSATVIWVGGEAHLYSGVIAGEGYDQSYHSEYGVRVGNGGTFQMHGGSITGVTTNSGTGVCVEENGTFLMDGGAITGNVMGVLVDGVFRASGDVVIDGNTSASGAPRNVVMYDKMELSGPLGENAQIGLGPYHWSDMNGQDPYLAVQGADSYAVTAADFAKLSCDNTDYYLALDEGTVSITATPPHAHAWATAWSSDGTHHWHECTADGCTITADSEKDGYAAHTPGDWQKDAANHWKACSACGYELSKAAHVYDDDQDATCNTCGYTRTVTPSEPEEGETKGEVEIKPGTPDVSVDEEVLKDLAGEAQEGQTVTVKLAVEKLTDPADKAELEAIIQGDKSGVLYLDFSLLKQINDQEPEAITDTVNTVLEIIVPYDFTGKKDVTVYRKHGSDPAQALTALSQRPIGDFADGTFFADADNGRIYIYASKFSTYAIAYTAEEPASTPSGSGGTVPNTYKPNIQQPEHGAITVSPAAPSKGGKATVTVKPDEGYEVDALTVTDKNGKSLEVTKNANGTYSYVQPGGRANISAVIKEAGAASAGDDDKPVGKTFVDVRETAWYYDDVYYCAEKGLMQGREDDAFDPEVTTSRAMIVTILWRLAGSPEADATLTYPDCQADTWYSQAMAWGTENGVVTGYDSGNFGPNDPITREQLALMLYRYAKFTGMDVSVGEDTNILSYKDFDELGEWAVEAMQWAAGAGIVNGKPDGLLDPKGQAMRAEAAAMLRRFCELAK